MSDGSARPRLKHRLFSLLRVLLALVVLYLGGYFVLMDRGTPAVWAGPKGEGMSCSWSSFRWARKLNGRPVYNDWNFMFAPLDRLYFEVFPSRFKLDMPTHYHSKRQKIQITDVTKAVTLTPASRPNLSVYGYAFNMHGNIDGLAEIVLPSTTHQFSGEFGLEGSGAYHETNFVIEYRPIKVRTGRILIEYEFKYVH
jgi:hypothetical protein